MSGHVRIIFILTQFCKSYLVDRNIQNPTQTSNWFYWIIGHHPPHHHHTNWVWGMAVLGEDPHENYFQIWTKSNPTWISDTCLVCLGRICLWTHLKCLTTLEKFPLAPRGVLAPGSVQAWPSAQPPSTPAKNFGAHVQNVCEICLINFPQIQNFLSGHRKDPRPFFTPKHFGPSGVHALPLAET